MIQPARTTYPLSYLASASHANQVVPLFAAKPRSISADVQKDIDATLQSYETELKALLAWDRAQHKKPVFQEIKVERLLESARKFLESRARQRPDQPYPFVLNVAGGTASGKTTLAKYLTREGLPEIAKVNYDWNIADFGPIINTISLDDYYKDFSARREALGDKAFFARTNVDTPKAMALAKARAHIQRLKRGNAVYTPIYSMHTSVRHENSRLKVPAPFFIVEGMFALHDNGIRDLAEMNIFVSIDRETQSERWWARAKERFVDQEGAKSIFGLSMARHDENVEPTKVFADVVVDGNADLKQLKHTLTRFSDLLMKHFYIAPPDVGYTH